MCVRFLTDLVDGWHARCETRPQDRTERDEIRDSVVDQRSVN